MSSREIGLNGAQVGKEIGANEAQVGLTSKELGGITGAGVRSPVGWVGIRDSRAGSVRKVGNGVGATGRVEHDERSGQKVEA
jgi:hypothetical protein